MSESGVDSSDLREHCRAVVYTFALSKTKTSILAKDNNDYSDYSDYNNCNDYNDYRDSDLDLD